MSLTQFISPKHTYYVQKFLSHFFFFFLIMSRLSEYFFFMLNIQEYNFSQIKTQSVKLILGGFE
jgi:hypothetical protein